MIIQLINKVGQGALQKVDTRKKDAIVGISILSHAPRGVSNQNNIVILARNNSCLRTANITNQHISARSAINRAIRIARGVVDCVINSLVGRVSYILADDKTFVVIGDGRIDRASDDGGC